MILRSGAFAAELYRLRSWAAVWAVIGAWSTLALLFAYVFPYLSYVTGDFTYADPTVGRLVLAVLMSPQRVPDVAIQAMPLFGGAMMTVLGVLAAGSGYSWGSWKTAATQQVPRRTLIAGSLVAATCFVVGLTLCTFVLYLGVAQAIAHGQDLPTEWPAAGRLLRAAAVGFGVLETWLLIGYALGTAFRGTGLPLGLALVWTLVVENLLRGVGVLLPAMATLTDLLPGTAAGSLVGATIGPQLGDGTPGVITDISVGRAAVTVVAYAVVATALAVGLFTRRDLP